MRICGMELKSNYAVLALIDFDEDDIIDYIDLKIKKIVLEDDENSEEVKEFYNSINEFLSNNSVNKVVIKKRSKKGTFSGGAVTFKMEGLIQLNKVCEVSLISSQSVSSFEKKNMITFPKVLKKYQESAYLTILSSI